MTRSKNRVHIYSPVTLFLPESQSRVEALLVDISLTGMRVKLEHTGQLKDKAIVEWIPVVGVDCVSLEVSRVWEKSGDEVGVTFTGLDAKQKALIGAYVKYHRDGVG